VLQINDEIKDSLRMVRMDKNKISNIFNFTAKPIGEWLLKKRFRQNSYYYKKVKNNNIKKNTFLFESYHAVNLTGNVYAIFNQLADNYSDGIYYWAVKDLEDPMISFIKEKHEHVKFIKYESKKYYTILATAEYLVNDTSFMPYFIKKDGQKYINTWHGTPLKTLGLDIKNSRINLHKNIQRNLLQSDILLMPNHFTAEKLLTSHGLNGIYKGKVYITGNARVDNIFKDPIEIKKKYDLPRDKKIVLYAPTWKKSISQTTEQDILALLDEVNGIQDSLSEDYKVLLKAHYFIYDKFTEMGFEDRVVPNWVDTNELLASVDRLITDYSSIFFDFLPLQKPIYFYIPDKISYEKLRGFYLNIDSLPGYVSNNLNDIKEILLMEENKYIAEYSSQIEHYLKEFCANDLGNSSENAMNIILGNESSITPVSFDSQKEVIVMYGGGFYNNGITNSLISLSKNLNYNKYELIVLESDRMNASKEANLRKLDPRAKVMFRFSYTVRTLTSTYNQNLYYHSGYNFKYLSKKSLKNDVEWEFKRLFGNLKPKFGIDFGGYNKVYNLFIALSPFEKKTVFLHNTMLEEYNKMNGNKYKHRWNLKVIFSAYNLFDKIVSVSESANEQNQIDLKPFGVDSSKMEFVNNTINGEEILAKTDEYKKINHGNLIVSSVDGKKRLGYEETINIFDVQKISAIIPPDPEKIKFINVARLSPEKNHFTLIDAFEKVYQLNENARLYIVGDGPIAGSLINYVQEKNLENQITFYGFLDNPIPLIDICDCFVFPSNYEGQGLALIEAMILKKPVIGTRVPGITSVLKNYPNSLVENNADEIASAMLKYIDGKITSNDFDFVKYNEEAVDQFYRIIC